MKLKTLLVSTVALLCSVGAWADQTSILTSAGWTAVTSLDGLSSGINNNVYVFVDAGASNYFVSKGPGNSDRPKYIALADPFSTPDAVWTLEPRGTNKYAMRNLSSNYYFNSSSNGWQDFMDPSWTSSGTFDFAYASSKFSLTNSSVTDNNYVGPWGDGLSSVTSEQDVACNKPSGSAPGFKIYAMSRSDYAKGYAKAKWASSSSIDVTFLIVNPNIYHTGDRGNMPSGGWTTFGTQKSNGNRVTDNSSTNDVKMEGWYSSENSDMNIDYYQTLNSLANGKYSATATTYDQYNRNSAYLYTYCSTASPDKVKTAMTSTEEAITTPFIEVNNSNNGSVNIGMSFSGWGTWMTADNFKLTFKPYITAVASSYPTDGSLAAEAWYVYTIPMTGDYYFSATSGVVYTTNGDQEAYSASTTAATTKVSFTKDDKVYVKSTSAQTVKIEGRFYLATTVGGVTKWLNKNASGYTYVYDRGLQFVLETSDYTNYQLKFSTGNYLNDVGSNWQTKAEGSNNNDWQLSSVDGGYKLLLKKNTLCELFVKDTSTGLVEITHSTTDGNTWKFVTPDDYANYAALADINDKISAVGILPYADSEKKPSVYNASSASDAATHAASLTTALRAYVESNAMGEGVSATDYTSSILEHSCLAEAINPDDKVEYVSEYWTCARVRVNSGAGYTNSVGTTKEIYFDSTGRFWDNSYANASLSQTVTSLPAGKYLLTVCSRSETGSILTLSANEKNVTGTSIGSTGGVFGNGWNDTSLLCMVGNNGTANISLTGTKGSADHPWFSADNFRLVRIGDLDGVTISETSTSAPSVSTDFEKIILTRTLSNSYWNTFCSPIAIDAATITSIFGEGTQITEFDTSADITDNTLTFKSASSIVAGRPYLIKPANDAPSLVFDGYKVTATEGETVSKGSFKFIGVIPQIALKKTEADESVNYFVNTSNKVVQLSEDGNLKGMRAYFNVGSGVSLVKLFIDGIETGIETIDGLALTPDSKAPIYNLAGQKLSKPMKGVNIINGKKVLVK